ncbi:hypothetical protein K435DRAFT_398581 [Dendrothele bispora CBS 962.96]|uniref:IRG-type G domain-containing protein n=1 Tax=Dendrothele bispora (strain CBS 962.96) TaxID=1314807 RepID=A0A4S8L871_DENBC|nr:hypothetical protein K435DRAFT_398581 [Dendrothele bispora CBS 962.96]
MAFFLPFIPLAVNLLESLFGVRGGRNKSLDAIEQRFAEETEARKRAEERALKAEQAKIEAEKANVRLEQMRQAEAEAARLTKKAAEEADRRAETERQEMEKAEREKGNVGKRTKVGEGTVRGEQERAEAERRAREQAERNKRQAKEAMEQARIAREAAEAVAEQTRVEQEKADRAARETTVGTGEKGETVQPVAWPSPEEYTRTLNARQYQEGKFHFAVAGSFGSGKSSLINAFRGVMNGASGAAAATTGARSTGTNTDVVGRYPDPEPKRPFIWYDIPGADTLTVKDWDYFNKQGLYIFDVIIVLFDNRFTATDIAILRNCARWKIPTLIVRSKSDQQIENAKNISVNKIEADVSLTKAEKKSRLESVSNTAIDEYRSNTLQNVEKSLKEAGLENHQEVYLVSYNALLSVINGKSTRNALYLDEAKLFTKLVEAAQKRRSCPASQESGPTPSPRESGEGEKKSGNVFGKFTGAVKQFGGGQLERK